MGLEALHKRKPLQKVNEFKVGVGGRLSSLKDVLSFELCGDLFFESGWSLSEVFFEFVFFDSFFEFFE